MTKTIVVEVERRYPHAKYKKVITAHSKFYAHDEKSEAKVGDTVLIEETRPLSKLKRWRLTKVVAARPGRCDFTESWKMPGPTTTRCWRSSIKCARV